MCTSRAKNLDSAETLKGPLAKGSSCVSPTLLTSSHTNKSSVDRRLSFHLTSCSSDHCDEHHDEHHHWHERHQRLRPSTWRYGKAKENVVQPQSRSPSRRWSERYGPEHNARIRRARLHGQSTSQKRVHDWLLPHSLDQTACRRSDHHGGDGGSGTRSVRSGPCAIEELSCLVSSSSGQTRG